MVCRAQQWAQIALAVLIVTMICVAAVRAEPTNFCTTPGLADGAAFDACVDGSIVLDSAAFRGLVATCRGVDVGAASCISAGGTFAWRDSSSLTASDLIVDAGGTGAWVEWSGFSFFEPPLSGGGDEFSLSDLDQAVLARLFGIGFVMVTTAWGLGKGVALVLRMVR